MVRKQTTMAASFSEDIFAEILKRLPVSSIIKFMLVQKSWYRLIQSPYFNTLYSQHQKNNYILFHCYKNPFISLCVNDTQCNQYSSLPYPPTYQGRYRKIYGISNGLICVGVSTHSMDMKLSHIYLWNPIIRKHKTLPHPPPILDSQTCTRSVFNDLFFGYVPEINDYKLIEIVHCLDEGGKHLSGKVGVYVYSLSTNSWKTVSEDNFAKSENFADPVMVNGAVYWVGETEQAMLIGCFDMESEIIREIMLPPRYLSYDKDIGNTLVQNCSDLFLCCRYYKGNHYILDIWILEKEGGIKDVWRKKFTLDLDRIEKGGRWFPQCFRNDNEIILTNYTNYGPTRGFRYTSYDIEKDEPTEIIDDLSDLYSVHDIRRTLQISASLFVENLVLLGDNSS